MAGSKVVITTFKNEAPYILEWVAHYRVLGFDQIVVYTNDCSDGTNRILTRLQEMGEVHFHINKVGAGGIHRSALRQAARLQVVQEADWLFVCDVDEFLNIHVGDHKIDDLIAATGDVDAITVPWKIFSSNGRSVLRNTPVTEQFTDAELPPVEGGATRRFVKTLFRQKDIYKRIGLHTPVLQAEHADDFTWATPGGAQRNSGAPSGHASDRFGYETAQLNHYAVRSVESYLLKRHRGRANHMSHTLGLEYWDRWNRGGEEDLSIQRYAPARAAQMDHYLADDTLARLHRKGFRWHKAKIEELKADPDYTALRKSCETRLTRTAPSNDAPPLPLRPAQPLAEALERPAAQLPIGTLWIGTRLSYVEQMCLLSFVRQGHPVTLFSYGPVANLPEGIAHVDAREIHEPREFLYSKFGTPVVQSDIFRLHMIAKTGMVWADSDVVCLQPIEADEGHVHGFFSGPSVCNALLRLPPDSETLARYIDYVSDPYPIPPWWGADQRAEATALKAAGQWKHAAEQAHDIYGPPALTHFLRETGDLAHSRPAAEYYPVPFKELDRLIEPSDVDSTHFTDATRAVHLWARRLRWRLPQLGLQRGSFIYKMLDELDINPTIAPLPDPDTRDIFAPAQVLPRSVTAEAILDDTPEEMSGRQKAFIDTPEMDASIRVAEAVLHVAREDGLYGFHAPVPAGYRRGIDDHGTGAHGAFRLANSIHRYASASGAVPDFLSPTGAIEKLNIWKHFGAMPIPTPADKLQGHAFVPEALRGALIVPDRPWISDKPDLPRTGEIPDGTYFLKANHSHGARRVTYPLSDEDCEKLIPYCEGQLTKNHGFWASEWWYAHIPRRVFLERHLSEDVTQDVPDWKFWTFGGRAMLVQADFDRQTNHTQYVHDRDLTFIPHELFFPGASEAAPRPELYDEMLAMAEGIGASVDFARIDLYHTAKGIAVGEVTLCPMGAGQKIRSAEMDQRLSAAWDRTALFGAARPERAA